MRIAIVVGLLGCSPVWASTGIAARAECTPSLARLVAAWEGEEPRPNSDYGAERDAIVQQLVKDLEAVADWCNATQVFAERDRVFVTILELDPENVRAHKGLRHQQTREGKWIPPSDPVPSRNFDRAALAKFPEKLHAAIQPACASLFALGERFQLDPRTLIELFELVLKLDPDDARVHAARGEVKVGDRWLLAETATAKARRAALKDLVRRALASAPEPEPGTPTPQEQQLGLAWSAIAVMPNLRVVSTGSREEAVKVAKTAWSSVELFRVMFDAKAALPDSFVVYLLANPAQKDAFLQKHPGVTNESRPFLSALQSSGITYREVGTWMDDPELRLDSVSRHMFSTLFLSSFKLTTRHGWAFEGFGLYLVRELTGTRLTWYVQPDGFGQSVQQALRKRLMVKDCNWMNEALQMIESDRRPALGAVLKQDVNTLSVEDMLYGYVFAVYLLEAQEGALVPLLTELGQDTPPEEAVAKSLGSDLPALEQKLRRWLTERR